MSSGLPIYQRATLALVGNSASTSPRTQAQIARCQRTAEILGAILADDELEASDPLGDALDDRHVRFLRW